MVLMWTGNEFQTLYLGSFPGQNSLVSSTGGGGMSYALRQICQQNENTDDIYLILINYFTYFNFIYT